MKQFLIIQSIYQKIDWYDLSFLHGGVHGDEGGDLVWDCHMFARAFGQIYNLPIVDGSFKKTCHSWLLLGQNILDIYPAGGQLGGPKLIVVSSTARSMFSAAEDYLAFSPDQAIAEIRNLTHPHMEAAIDLLKKEITRVTSS